MIQSAKKFTLNLKNDCQIYDFPSGSYGDNLLTIENSD